MIPVMREATPFRFDAAAHEYFLEGQRVPGITEMLDRGGLYDKTWYTEASRQRGTAVHDLTSAFDLEALEVESCHSPYRNYLLAHVAAMRALKPDWWDIEVPRVHPLLKFGGRCDRVGLVFQRRTILEEKSGAVEKAHQVQTALQAILLESVYALPAEAWQRLALYLGPKGKFKLYEHKDTHADFAEARRLLKCFAG